MTRRILLVSMPYGAIERPALGLSLLQPLLRRRGIDCAVRYLNFDFAELIGQDLYQMVSFELPYTAFAGDWTFTEALYGSRPEVDAAYLEGVLRRGWNQSDETIRRAQAVRQLVPHFIDHCLATVPWDDYALVGFTSTFEQNIASLALARQVKAQHPHVAIVFGGANWEGEMGQELHRQFPFVDYICSGEADESFPALAERVIAGAGVDDVPGVVFRRDGVTVATGPASLVRDLDSLPLPDFTDFFTAFDRCGAVAGVVPTLLFESSRGCWWGARSHCTFCGLNGGAMAFRSKSPERALVEIDALVDRWQIELVEAVDNILDMRYFERFMPLLAAREQKPMIFYEVKANLQRRHVEALRDAGVYRIQPGIESMSDRVLALMRKGTTALRNIQLLKWCRELGVTAEWNILYGFPGETAEDYARTLDLLHAIRFLGAPAACGPVRLDRFSPYFNTPEAFGLKNVRPMTTYRYLYPFDDASLARIAYYFEYDYDAAVDPAGHAAAVVAYAEEWKNAPEPGTLVIGEEGDALVLLDSRSTATIPRLELRGLERAAYDYCDETRSGVAIVRHLREQGSETFDDADVFAFLDSLVANALMVTDGVHYLSLALRQPAAAGVSFAT